MEPSDRPLRIAALKSRTQFRQLISTLLLTMLPATAAWGWGFEAHRTINRHAVFTLPPAMFNFYKYYIHFLTEHAVNPDKRRYAVVGEAPRHYIDLEYYHTCTPQAVPRQWAQAQEAYPEAMLMEHGTLPWHLILVKHRLTKAFERRDVVRILRLSADIGHYLADANVPLHTTENYNGQLTDQEGIHGLWETRIPALFTQGYDLFVGPATYVDAPQQKIWEAVEKAHQAVESILRREKELSATFSAIRKYSYEQHGSTLRRVYAEAYVCAYHDLLQGQVEQQMRASIKMVGDFWYTCWVDAGQPDLTQLLGLPLDDARLKEALPTRRQLPVRCCGEH